MGMILTVLTTLVFGAVTSQVVSSAVKSTRDFDDSKTSVQDPPKSVFSEVVDETKAAAVVGGAAVGGLVLSKAVAKKLIPYSMKYFGKVVSGFGTFHSSKGITAFLQKFVAGTAGPTVAGAFVAGATAYGAYRFLQSKEPSTTTEPASTSDSAVPSQEEENQGVPSLSAYVVAPLPDLAAFEVPAPNPQQ